MLPYLLIITIFYSLPYLFLAFEPSCSTCKHFMESKTNPELGCCKMFKNFDDSDKYKRKKIYEFAMHCRNNENMCGKLGFLYEEKNNNLNNEVDDDLLDIYEELNNRCCGEVNEQYEIEQLERDFFELFQKIKKFNTKRIYKTTRDLFKLFRRKT